jgi:ubiquitin thioesterase OTU1
VSVDVLTGRADRFGQHKFDKSVLVIYSGIHYDAIALTPSPTSPSAFDQTSFNTAHIAEAVVAVQQIAGVWRRKHKYTDMATFTLKCGVCGTGLRGEREAQGHAQETGHVSFTEYS